ncbi:MAG TPA: cytochrome oxidase [bacterium]|nr:cytochrome oxidase [bacterium]
MNIVPVLLFCSLVLVVGALLLFVFSAKQGDCHESDRLCLMPLEDDAEARPADRAQEIDPPSLETE